jgi:pimeloyl-ACP methyl ester carboxylesterase
MNSITTKDGVEIFYKDWGTGQSIVFSHGWPLSADDWDTQMLFFLRHGYRVIAHDRRGHGRSTQVPGQRKPPVDELTMSLTDNLAIVDVWAGSAELRIPEVQGEDMHLIAPLRVGRGYRLGMAYSVTDLRILKNYAA